MSLATVIGGIILVAIAILIANVISAFNSSAPKPTKYPVKYEAFNNSGFEVDREEWREIQVLNKPSFFSNKYCRERILELYFTVRREYRLQIEQDTEAALGLCKIAVLEKLNFNPPLEDRAGYESRLKNPELCCAIEKMCHEVVKPIADDDEDFYSDNSDAWEVSYHQLQATFNPKEAESFYDKACQLAKRNKRVMVIRKIYFDSYLLLVEIDREYALRFYLHYLDVSTSIQHRKITRKNAKKLFRKPGENERFDAICADLLLHKDLPNVLEQFDRMQISQRKKISLSVQAIQAAAEKQSKVAGVLTEWLADEEMPVAHEAVKNVPEETPVATPAESSKEALIRLFIANAYRINKEEVDIFARSRGLFTGGLIEGINDEHFETLDDVLIEEDEEYYILNEAYCRQIQKG